MSDHCTTGALAPKNRRGGRPKGALNKITVTLKDMVIAALGDAGGVDYLVRQANENPVAFLTLLAKILPLQIKGAGDNGEVVIEVRETIHDPRLQDR